MTEKLRLQRWVRDPRQITRWSAAEAETKRNEKFSRPSTDGRRTVRLLVNSEPNNVCVRLPQTPEDKIEAWE